ncbi:MAG: hypothetical protein WCF90_10075 [Methanomicrobiales archaeon]
MNCVAVTGSLIEASFPYPKNTLVAIGIDGKYCPHTQKFTCFSRHWKTSAFLQEPTRAFSSSDRIPEGLRSALILGHPSLFRIYAQKGVHAVFVPAALLASRIRHWEFFILARAAENQLYAIGVNTT